VISYSGDSNGRNAIQRSITIDNRLQGLQNSGKELLTLFDPKAIGRNLEDRLFTDDLKEKEKLFLAAIHFSVDHHAFLFRHDNCYRPDDADDEESWHRQEETEWNENRYHYQPRDEHGEEDVYKDLECTEEIEKSHVFHHR
jgi:hypothetical protein